MIKRNKIFSLLKNILLAKACNNPGQAHIDIISCRSLCFFIFNRNYMNINIAIFKN